MKDAETVKTTEDERSTLPMTSPRRGGQNRRTVPPPKPGGRPTKFTPEVHANIRLAVRSGSFVKHAAQANGIGESTVLSWLKKGEEHAPACAGLDEWSEDRRQLVRRCRVAGHEYLEFLESVERAKGEALVHASAKLMTAVNAGDVKAILSFLRQHAPEQWTPLDERKVRLDTVQGPSGPPLIIQLIDSGRDPKELAELMSELEAPGHDERQSTTVTDLEGAAGRLAPALDGRVMQFGASLGDESPPRASGAGHDGRPRGQYRRPDPENWHNKAF